MTTPCNCCSGSPTTRLPHSVRISGRRSNTSSRDRARVLVVERTGWGKSAVYFVATRLLRDRGAGPTVLISPLLALMRNQLLMAERAGVRAATINSGNREEWEAIEARIERDEIDLLLISPERLNNDRFRRDVLPDLARRVGLLVVDEAHCISDWGHDFRPDYRRIGRVIQLLPAGVPLLCTTATANDRVVADIQEQLGDDLVVIRGTLHRESLALAVIDMPGAAQRMSWLATLLPTLDGAGIVYAMTIRDADVVAEWLQLNGIDAHAYHGAIEPELRVELENRLLANELKALVATSALGMGFDKPDLAFVIHYQSPGSAIAYYQQVGRAGPGAAECVGRPPARRGRPQHPGLLHRDRVPAARQAEQVVALLAERAEPVSVGDIEAHVNVKRSRLTAMMKILEVDGAVEAVGGRWQRTLAPWAYDQERVDRVTAERRAEQQAMIDLRHHQRMPHGVPARPARRPPRHSVRAVRQLPGPAVERRSSMPGSSTRREPSRAIARSTSNRGACGRRGSTRPGARSRPIASCRPAGR